MPVILALGKRSAKCRAGAIAVEVQHVYFRLFKGGFGVGPEAGGVFFAGSQAEVVKGGRHLVVLRVGQVHGGLDGQGHGCEFLHDFHFGLQVVVAANASQLHQLRL
eukprot:scaffold4821_cov54-Attheya_sp.AAC.2